MTQQLSEQCKQTSHPPGRWSALGPLALVLVALAVVSAAPAGDAEDLVRQGNAAYARGDYEEAAVYYQRAEELATDPGLVAFNEAAALYEQGKYAEAEAHFRLCLGDAGPKISRRLEQHPRADLPAALRKQAGPRLARVLYNLGNCLLQRSQGTDADLLDQAVALYDHCLRAAAPKSLVADARHNLELARELRRRNPKPPRPDPSEAERPDEPDPSRPKDNPGSEASEPTTDPNRKNPAGKPEDDPRPGGDDPRTTEEARAGRGNLPTLPDSDALARLSPEDAAAHLRQALQRIRGERREYQRQTARKTPRHVLDW